MHKGRMTGINAALVSAFFLGLAPVFGKAAMGPDKFSPLAVVALRTGMAALLLFLIMVAIRRVKQVECQCGTNALCTLPLLCRHLAGVG